MIQLLPAQPCKHCGKLKSQHEGCLWGSEIHWCNRFENDSRTYEPAPRSTGETER